MGGGCGWGAASAGGILLGCTQVPVPHGDLSGLPLGSPTPQCSTPWPPDGQAAHLGEARVAGQGAHLSARQAVDGPGTAGH